MKLLAARTSALLSLLFVAVYWTCNWLTSQRDDVGAWYFEWEHVIPFAPLMIVPYMSIDLFFLAAPFLCRNERELKTFVRRVSFAIVTASACFLLFPLRLAVERPAVGGWLGEIFNPFQSIDKPHNLFPSLHAALLVILTDSFARRTSGVTRVAVGVWFTLIGLSTVLTYQHHVVDVLGGLALGGVCLYLFRQEETRLVVTPNRTIGLYYLLGAAMSTTLACVLRPWGALLLWPALALGIVATGYFGLGETVFRKKEGRLSLGTHLIFWPVLLGQRLSLLHYQRHCPPWDAITPNIWIGRLLSETEAAEAVRQGVTAVLDLTVEFSEARILRRVNYRNLPVLDLTGPTLSQLCDGVDFITRHSNHGTVYVHCKIGYSRSAAVVGAYLLSKGDAATPQVVADILRSARPSIVIRPEAMKALNDYSEKGLADQLKKSSSAVRCRIHSRSVWERELR